MSSPKDIKKPPAEVFNRFNVFSSLASTLAKNKQYQQSLPYFKLGEEFARGALQECTTWTGRAKVYMSMGEMGAARRDMNKALQACPDHLDTTLTNVNLLFAEDEIEESLIASHRGFKQRSIFGKNVRSAIGTIEKTIGRNAGNIMDMENLGKTIVRMKKKDLGQITDKQLTPQEKYKQDNIYENKLKCYTEMFLKENASDKMFFIDRLKDKTNVESEESMKNIMKAAVERIHKKQMSLWIREPIYTRALAQIKLSEIQIKENKESKAIKISVMNNEAVRQLTCLVKQLRKGDLVGTYHKAMHLWRYLMSKQEFELPNKKVFCDSLYEILASMYLGTKVLKKNMTDAQNDSRIYYLLGIYKPYTSAIEVFKCDFHADIFDFKKFVNEITGYMKNTTSPLDMAFLSHELSCAYSMNQKHEAARFYSRICCYESKKAENLTWYLNGLFLLTRSELQEANITEAKITLTAARDLAMLFSFKEIHDFIVRSLNVISRETESSLRGSASIAKREKQLFDMMATQELKSKMKNQLQYIRNLPPHLRLSVLPGVKTKKEKKKIQPRITLEAQLREEQNVQYLIRQRYTLQSSEIKMPNYA